MNSFRFTGDTAELTHGLSLLKNELSAEGAPAAFPVKVTRREEPGFSVRICGNDAEIRYREKADFFRALPFLARHAGEPGFQAGQTPCFEKTGVMIDCSRNAVPTVESLKKLLRKMALMGLNTAMLYTEDTYEVKSRPYFGYLRGRYSFDELRELDDCADALGIEMIPCIQTLSHLERALQWPAMEQLRDGERSLMVGDESAYAFVEEMITAASAPFRTKRIHIGMDEAWELGLGRYLNLHGFRPCRELMAEHLRRVHAILQKHGLHAMMWSDMHFTAASPTRDLYDPNCVFTPEYTANIPQDIDLVYWDYYNDTEPHYDRLLTLHEQLPAKTVFAGGIWAWIGPAVDYEKTVSATVPALNQCKKHGVREVVATIWNDDGAEAPLEAALLGMQLFAEYRYTGRYDKQDVLERFRDCCGMDGQAFFDLSRFNQLPGFPPAPGGIVTPAKILLYEDPLIPLFETDFSGLPCAPYYAALARQYRAYAQAEPKAAALFDFYAKLADTVSQKSVWREAAAACVRGGDRRGAAEMEALADGCIAALRELRGAWAKLWYAANKPFGYEVLDLRTAGLIGRFETAKMRFSQFAAGEIETIPELAEPKLPYTKLGDGTFRWLSSWGAMASVSRIV